MNPITIGTFAESEERIVPQEHVGIVETSNSAKQDPEKGISVTTETEVEVRSIASRNREGDLHGYFSDGMANGAKGYNVYVNK